MLKLLTLVSSLDELPLSDSELERLPPIMAAVELRTVRVERAGVVGGDLRSRKGWAECAIGSGLEYCLHYAAVLGDADVDGIAARHDDVGKLQEYLISLR